MSRDINDLEENFKLKVDLWLKECPEIFITETYRTPERQRELYDKGLSFLDGENRISEHQRRKAVDVAFHGDKLYPEDHTQWRIIANKAKEYGIEWGFDLWGWDKCHFQDNGKLLIIPEPKEIDKEKTECDNKGCKIIFPKKSKMEISGYIYAPKEVEDQMNFLIRLANDKGVSFELGNPNPEEMYKGFTRLMFDLWVKLDTEEEEQADNAYNEIVENYIEQRKSFEESGKYLEYNTKSKSND